MNILLWVLQILLALHTAVGAVWKFLNPAQTLPALAALPREVWLVLGGLEILAALGLVLPLRGRGRPFRSISAFFVAAEMLLFCVLSLLSGSAEFGELAYWLVVALVAVLIAIGGRTLRSSQKRN